MFRHLSVVLILIAVAAGGADAQRCVSGNCDEGKGTMVTASGLQYSGAWDNGRPEGTGRLDYPDGDVYMGEVVRGEKHGLGIYMLEELDIISMGTFRNGGYGGDIVVFNPDGVIFEATGEGTQLSDHVYLRGSEASFQQFALQLNLATFEPARSTVWFELADDERWFIRYHPYLGEDEFLSVPIEDAVLRRLDAEFVELRCSDGTACITHDGEAQRRARLPAGDPEAAVDAMEAAREMARRY